jgi:hypothetical protein
MISRGNAYYAKDDYDRSIGDYSQASSSIQRIVAPIGTAAAPITSSAITVVP